MTLKEALEKKRDELAKNVKDIGFGFPGIYVEFGFDAAVDLLSPEMERMKQHLVELCKPEPDGIGSFVSDEFTQKEVLEGRIYLEKHEEFIKGLG